MCVYIYHDIYMCVYIHTFCYAPPDLRAEYRTLAGRRVSVRRCLLSFDSPGCSPGPYAVATASSGGGISGGDRDSDVEATIPNVAEASPRRACGGGAGGSGAGNGGPVRAALVLVGMWEEIVFVAVACTSAHALRGHGDGLRAACERASERERHRRPRARAHALMLV